MRVVEVAATDTHDLRRRVLRSHAPGLPVSHPEDADPATRHFGVRADDGRLVAVVSFTPQPCPLRPGRTAVRFRGMAVDDGERGRGIGALLLAAAIDRVAAELPVEVVWAHGRDAAAPFYRRMGFVEVGDGFVESHLPHHVIVLDR